jgi:hypothetical protein
MRFIAVFCILCSLLLACSGNPGGSTDGYVTPDDTKAVSIHPNLWIYTAVDGTYLGTLDQGELVGASDKLEKSTKGWDYTQIKRSNGVEVWALASYLIKGTRPGIIVKEHFLYTEAKASALTSEKVGVYTIVAGYRDPKNPGFTQISYTYGKDNTSIKHKAYIKSENVSFFDADIQATLLFNKAQKAKDAEVKKEFLKSAVDLDSPSFRQVFATELAVLENVNDDSASKGSKDAVEYTGIFIGTEDGKYFHESPDASSSETESVGKNEEFTVDQRTKGTDEIDGARDYWYHSEGKGWIFGGYAIQK